MLGLWNTKPVQIDLNEEGTPYHGKPYPIPKLLLNAFLKVIARSEDIGVLKMTLHVSK